MSKVVPFTFEGAEVRVLSDRSGDPWFVAADLCRALGLGDHKGSFAHHLDKLDGDEKKSIARSVVQGTPTSKMGVVARAFAESAGGAVWAEPEIWMVSESGAYALILRSREATTPGTVPHRLRKWITAEVLPSIRKTGGYKAPKAEPSQLKLTTEAARAFPPLFRIARLLGCDKNAAAISANQAVLQLSKVNLLQGLGQTHLEAANQESRFYTPTELGRLVSPEVGARNVNLLLAEAGMQFKRNDVWEVSDAGREFARVYDTGKKHGSGVPVTQIKWSPSVLSLLGEQRDAA